MSTNLLLLLISLEVELEKSYYSQLIVSSNILEEDKAELLLLLYTDITAFRRQCVTQIGTTRWWDDGENIRD